MKTKFLVVSISVDPTTGKFISRHGENIISTHATRTAAWNKIRSTTARQKMRMWDNKLELREVSGGACVCSAELQFDCAIER